MKKLLAIIFVTGLLMSCQKKEQSSTEAENLQIDSKDAGRDAKEYSKVGIDSMAKDVKEQSQQKDGFEGKQSQY